jgi:hypothetical protein
MQQPFRRIRNYLPAVVVLMASAAGHTQTGDADIKLNQIQVIGTHNSYHAGIAPSEVKLLQAKHPEAFQGLDYQHQPLAQQFDSGVRQI